MPSTPRGDEQPTELAPRQTKERAASRFRLTVVEGPGAGASLVIDDASPSRVYVGQSRGCELVLADPRVSRRHLALEQVEGGLRVADLDSTNGTFVDRVRVYAALLTGQEIVRAGDTTLRLDLELATVPAPLTSATEFGRVVGASSEMRRLYPLFEKLARSDVSLVIEGETGTGKEVLAEAIHDASERASGPFVVFDCTAVPPTLVESELFGHERGAFTGAVTSRRGVFEQAQGGTLLIDEIGELEPSLQPKLLRALQRGEVRRLGGEQWIKVDVRIMAATRRDLDREVQDGRFRDDLYFRLAVARVELPSLRSRRGDVSALAHHFWRELGAQGKPPYELLRRLERHTWPGNVRELANAVARHLALGELESHGTPPPSRNATGDIVEETLALKLPFPLARDRVLAEFEQRYLEQVLALHGGNVTKAAEASHIGRRYFTRIASRHAKTPK